MKRYIFVIHGVSQLICALIALLSIFSAIFLSFSKVFGFRGHGTWGDVAGMLIGALVFFALSVRFGEHKNFNK
jgi:hypothetical protein